MALQITTPFIFTPGNLIENIERLGAWSSYGLAHSALAYYFPKEFEGRISVEQEVKLLESMGFNSWQEVIIKYHNEVGYNEKTLSDEGRVNFF